MPCSVSRVLNLVENVHQYAGQTSLHNGTKIQHALDPNVAQQRGAVNSSGMDGSIQFLLFRL